MIIPPEEQRLLDTLRGNHEDLRRAFRYGCLYGRYQALRAASDAINNLPSVFGLPDVETAPEQDEIERAVKPADVNAELLATLELWGRAYSLLADDEARAARIEASKKTDALLAKVRAIAELQNGEVA